MSQPPPPPLPEDAQQELTRLAATVLSGLLSGAMTRPNFDTGSIRPHHVQAAVNLALALREEVRSRFR